MSKVNEEDLPILSIFSLEDIQLMALQQVLGVPNIRQFLAENSVEYKCVLKANVGLAITITKVSTVTRASKE